MPGILIIAMLNSGRWAMILMNLQSLVHLIAGLKKPIKLYSLPSTELNKPITLSCAFGKRVGEWANDIAAKKIDHVGGYNCRKINGSTLMSQPSYGKAIDVVSINNIPILEKWREASDSACKYFNNVFGPGSDKAQANHLHLDSGLGFQCLFN